MIDQGFPENGLEWKECAFGSQLIPGKISLTSPSNRDNLAPVARAGSAGKLAGRAQKFYAGERKCQMNAM
jgi:hypothetical protein